MFVLMFAQQTNLLDYDTHKQNPIAAGVVAIALAATVIAVVAKEFPKLEEQILMQNELAEVAASEPDKTSKSLEGVAKAESDVKSEPLALNTSTSVDEKTVSNSEVAASAKADRFTVAKLGAAFYTRYLLAIEIAGTLLLVATIGAVVIAQRETRADAKEETKT
jgi:hypothetical protein